MTFLIALWGNVHSLMIAVAFISGLTAIGLGTAWGIYAGEAQFSAAKDAANAANCKRFFKRAAIAACISTMFSALPDADDIWRARIALVKLELAAPENAQKGAEEIVRIARRLECKYLGCEEEKEKEKTP
jgi:hypothetical protein